MPLNLTVTLDSKSIERAIRQVKQYKADLERKNAEFCERLAMLGAQVLRSTYSGAMYAGTNDVEVTVDIDGDMAILRANGEALFFIEFGAGIDYPAGQYAAAAGAVPHGTYGKGKGAHPPWTYVGDQGNAGQPVGRKGGVYRTYGNPPADAFQAAMTELMNAAREIAAEVFGT